MADCILIAGDQVNFMPAFGSAMVVVKPGKLKASSQNVRINGKPACLAKDSKNVKVAGCTYMAPPFVLPGNGTESIQQLAANQISKKVKCNGKPLLLKGTQFQAQFKVGAQAKIPPAPPVPAIPDPLPQYPGMGLFQNANSKVRAS